MLQIRLLIFFFLTAYSLKIQRVIKLSQSKQSHGLFILGGFSFSPGTIQVQSLLQIFSQFSQPNGYQLEIRLLTHGELQREKISDCSLVKTELRLDVNLVEHETEFEGRNNTIIVSKVNQFMFVVLRDCSQTLIKQYFQENALLNIEIEILNNESHLSQTQWIYHWLVVISLTSNLFMGIKLKKFLKNYDIDVISVYLSAYFALAILLCACEQVIQIFCVLEGTDNYLIKILYNIFATISQVLFIFILSNLALGWTIETSSLQLFSDKISNTISTFFAFIIISLSSNCEKDLSKSTIKLWSEGIIFSSSFILASLIAVKWNQSNSISKRFFIRMFLITLIKIISSQFIFLFLDAQIYSINKTIILSSTLLLRLTINYLIILSFVGPSSSYFKVCLSNQSFME